MKKVAVAGKVASRHLTPLRQAGAGDDGRKERDNLLAAGAKTDPRSLIERDGTPIVEFSWIGYDE